MAGSYRAEGLVLRRTKLGEADLIVTLLTDGTSQVRAVAKGARRPGSKLAGVVGLGNEGSFLLHEGRNLDTIAEGRLQVSRSELALDYERCVMAEAVLDSAAELTAEGEHDPRLLPLTQAALDAVGEAPVERLPLVGAAYLLKAAAMQGYRPCLECCVRCGEGLGENPSTRLLFSFEEGGLLCSTCAEAGEGRPLAGTLVAWVRALLGLRFAELLAMEAVGDELRLGYDALEFGRRWLEFHPGVRPRALGFALGHCE